MSAHPQHCDDCFKGVRHEGEPQGEIVKIGGVESYVATPKGDYPKDKVVLFLTDVFGIPLINNKLLADDFAENGWRTIIPDILNGDPIIDFNDPAFDRNAWIARHDINSWTEAVDKVVAALKAEGVTRIGTTGFCFGAPPAFYLAFKHESHVTVVSHPSRLAVPDDLEKYRKEATAPLLINSCEVDAQFPIESQKVADEVLGNGQFAPGYERTYWDGCTHGFAVRGDMNNPKIKAGKEGAFLASVKFYKKYL
ncbi:alpha/beta-hydrolase [Irpex rosettiformis]|uniref:Alpha/beta-hydrolase n=1 Tax=Irpex rosettiformis TaxID=378272 RepID=A0ACB8TUI4_9APHY|nr:alpha/beta-hydrolase [Irpex rosettiformis]